MKVLFLQDHATSGGAARAGQRWAVQLRRQGDATNVVAGDEAEERGHRLTGKPGRGWGRLREWLGGGRRSEKVRRVFLEILKQEQPDLIWCHNLAGGEKWGWGEFLVSMASAQAPVLWTLHDMWALGEGTESYWEEGSAVTGRKGAGFVGGQAQRCEGGKGGMKGGSRVEKVFREKAKFPITLTAPSQWLAELTGKITGHSCRALPNPIDLEVYRPGNREQARQRLGLPSEGFLVLAGADSLEDRRKGFDLLRTAWAGLKPRKATLVLFGRHGVSEPGIRYLGSIDSDARMIEAYQAADLYVHPARIENASCQIQEAMACGIPTLAFATGGNPEWIRPGRSGLLAPRIDAESLAAELERAWHLGPGLEAIGKEARNQALTMWDPDALAQSFRNVVVGLRG